ncbi:MAG: pilus assembly protein TadG-related protein [Micrococcus sp.]|nr:pilus assembly protein TadG-related protein [Micrococcus sp.]
MKRDEAPCPSASGPRGESGQITVLTLGMSAIIIALLLVMLATTSVTLQARKLQSFADGAALAGAEAARLATDDSGRVALTDAEVQSAVQSYLADVSASTTIPGMTGVSARLSADGTSVDVFLTATVAVTPADGLVGLHLPAVIPIDAAGDSRTILRR